MKIARNAGHGRVVSLLEGGYDPGGLAEAVYSHVKTLKEFEP